MSDRDNMSGIRSEAHKPSVDSDFIDAGEYGPIMAALPAFDGFARGTLMKQRGSLTKTQMDVLTELRFSGKTSMGRLAERVAVSKEQASRAVAPLVKKGLVNRSRNPERYRVVEVDLTEKGREFLEATRDEIGRDIGERLAALSDEDRRSLIEASRTAVRILRKLTPSTVPPPSPTGR